MQGSFRPLRFGIAMNVLPPLRRAGLAAVCLFALSAAAQPSPTPEHAAEIAAQLQAFTDRYAANMLGAPIDARWLVEVEDGGYRAALPAVEASGRFGQKLSLPETSFHIERLSEDELRLFDFRPQSFEIVAPQMDEAAWAIEAEAFHGEAIWSESLGFLRRFEWRFDRLTQSVEGLRYVDAEFVSLTGDLDCREPNRECHYVETMSAKDVMTPWFRAHKAQSAVHLDGVNLDALRIVESLDVGYAAPKGETQEEIARHAEQLGLAALADVANAWLIDMSAASMTIFAPEPALLVWGAKLSFVGDGMRGDAARVTFAWSHQDIFGIGANSTELEYILPQRAHFEVVAAPFPLRTVFETHGDKAQSQATILQAFAAARTRIELRDLSLATEAIADYQSVDGLIVEGAAALTIRPEVAIGFIGEASFVASGFDRAMQTFAPLAPSETLQRIRLGLAAAQGFGKVEMGPDGEALYRYELELRPDGAALLNGAPLDAVMDRIGR